MRSILLIIALASVVSLASAQRCQSELEAAAAGLPADTQQGVFAAELLASTVRLIEPTLPPLVWSPAVPIRPGEAGFDAAVYLAERGLLPASWRPDELSVAAWEAMLADFLAWYRLPRLTVASEPERSRVINDLVLALEAISEEVRPLALVASDSEDREQIAFLGLVWNWTIYPRLIVLRPEPGQTLEAGVQPLLEELGNCAVAVEHYVFAPEDTARRLFLTHSDARMYVIGSEPSSLEWPLLVPDGEEEEYFSFAAPVVSGLAAYAAAFEGSELGVRSLMSMLPRLRTNLPPMRIPGLLRTPDTN